ncbi:MAG: tripartite tricarboxylate transporter permease [Burkholderiaceae bacterium]
MDLSGDLALGFASAFTLHNLAAVVVGCVLGTLVGVLPGIGPAPAIAIALPTVYALQTTPALILLACLYFGARYGGSIGAILLDSGNDSRPAVASIDGAAMARQGRAGAALAAAGLSAFVAGAVAVAVVAALAAPLTELAFRFGPAEYFSLTLLGLIGAVAPASGALLKALAMLLFGLLLAQFDVGAVVGSALRDLDLREIQRGGGLVLLAIGLLVFGDVIARLGAPVLARRLVAMNLDGRPPTPTRQDLDDVAEAWPAVVRGTALGSLLGLLPGAGVRATSATAGAVEKRLAGPSGRFGKVDIRGVAGPEAANSAGAQTSFMPMLALGIPPNAVLALMLGALAMKGVEAGPRVMSSHPRFFWGLLVAMGLGHALLVLLNLPLTRLWMRALTVPYRVVFPAVVALACVGVYTLHPGVGVFCLSAAFAVAGYVFHKFGCAVTPLLLGFVLGPALDENLRHALRLSGGDWSVFVSRPLSAGLLAAAALVLVIAVLPSIGGKRDSRFQEV